MNGKKIVTSLDHILHWIIRMAAINILWFIFALLGLFVGGVFPSTVAALGVSRKLVMGEQDIKMISTFKQIYRQEFIKSNILGWVLLAAGGVLYLNYKVIVNSPGEIFIVAPFAFFLILFFYLIVLLWTFPLLAHYQASWFHHLKTALIIGLTKIHYTFGIGLLLFTVVYYSLSYPGLIPFFSISITALGCMGLSMRVFKGLDIVKNEELG